MAVDFQTFTRNLIADLRANAGRATSGPFQGRDVLILHTIGARTGQPRETVLAFRRLEDGGYLIAASKGGSDTHPHWFHNIVANPRVELEVLGERFAGVAHVPEGAERDRLYGLMIEMSPGFADYEKKTDRVIPTIVVKRV